MTGQIPDNVIYEGETYELVGVSGGELYEPQDFGLIPTSPHTANYRGFVSTYEIEENALILNSMEITVEEASDEYPKINKAVDTRLQRIH